MSLVMSDSTREEVRIIQQRLKQAFFRITLSDALAGLLLVLALGVTGWLILLGLESVLWMSLGARRWLVAGWALLVLTAAGALVVRPLFRLTSAEKPLQQEHVARLVGSRYPEVSDRLVNFLLLARDADNHLSSVFVDALHM